MNARSKSARLEAARSGSPIRAVLREGLHAGALVLAGASVLYMAVLLPSRIKTEQLRERRDELLASQKKLGAELESLRAETHALDSEPWAVERALRRRLGFLRPGEHVLKRGRSD